MDNLSPDQIKQMISMLQAMLTKDTISEPNDEPAQSTQQQTNIIKTVSPRQVNKTGNLVNRFDEMMESKLHQEDRAIDQALSVHSPTPRNRRSFDPINVVCRVCGRKDSVNPSMLSDSPSRYKCNSCARSPG
jgi:hypothetical protein